MLWCEPRWNLCTNRRRYSDSHHLPSGSLKRFWRDPAKRDYSSRSASLNAIVRSSLPAGSKTQIIGWDYNMQPAAPGSSTCPTCGGSLEKTPDGKLGCMFCLLQAGIGSEEETVHDSTPDALGSSTRFGVYEIDCHPDGSLYELGRGAMGVTYRATD